MLSATNLSPMIIVRQYQLHKHIKVWARWTAEVIIHLLNHALKDVPRNEEIVVLLPMTGIGTVDTVSTKMGFTNVKYYAYEIDKILWQSQTITTLILFNAEMRLQFERIVETPADSLRNGSMSYWR